MTPPSKDQDHSGITTVDQLQKATSAADIDGHACVIWDHEHP